MEATFSENVDGILVHLQYKSTTFLFEISLILCPLKIFDKVVFESYQTLLKGLDYNGVSQTKGYKTIFTQKDKEIFYESDDGVCTLKFTNEECVDAFTKILEHMLLCN